MFRLTTFSLTAKRVASAAGLAGAVFAASFTGTADAAISYGELEGTDFNYFSVLEDSATDPAPLFGEPSIGGNTMFFTSVGFAAFSECGVDLTDGTLAFRVESKDDETGILSLDFTEQGDYSLLGDHAAVTAGMSVFGLVTEIDGVDIDPISFSMSETFLDTALSGEVSPSGVNPWSGELSIDMASILSHAGIEGLATEVAIVLDNTLTAEAGGDSSALVNKKLFTVAATQIPEPSTAMLGLIGVLALGVMHRRRAA